MVQLLPKLPVTVDVDLRLLLDAGDDFDTNGYPVAEGGERPGELRGPFTGAGGTETESKANGCSIK